MPSPCYHLLFRALAFAVIVLPFTFDASAAFVTLEAEFEGETHPATVSTLFVDDVEYVSLLLLVEQWGGGYQVMPRRMRIELRGTTAWVGLNDTRVNALTIFSLDHAVLQQDDDVLIALSDLPEFFEKSFRVPVREAKPAANALRTLEPVDARPLERPRPLEFSPAAPRARPITIRGGSRPLPASGIRPPIRTILLDAGHGGYDLGVTSGTGAAEKEIVLAVAQKMARLLSQRISQEVVLTRTTDVELSVRQRAAIATNSGAQLLLSLHIDSSPRTLRSGPAVLHSPAIAGKRFAAPVADALAPDSAATLAQAIREALDAGLGGPVPAPVEAPLRLFAAAGLPGVHVELGVLSHAQDEELLRTAAHQDRLAEALAVGLQHFLQGYDANFSITPGDPALTRPVTP